MRHEPKPLPDSMRITIGAVDAWIELVPVRRTDLVPARDVYYRLEGGGRVVPRGAYTAHLNHARKSFTIEEDTGAA